MVMERTFGQAAASIVFPKRKKTFMAARCIISYAGYYLATTCKALGRIMSDMMPAVFDDQTFNSPTVQDMIDQLRKWNDAMTAVSRLLKEDKCTIEFEIIADDLEGFFPSAEQELMMKSAQWFLERLCNMYQSSPEDLCLAVSLKNKERCFRGTYRTASTHKSFYMRFFLPLLEHTLEAALAEVKGRTIRQIRGGPIGAPSSPAWLVLTVSLKDYVWLNSLRPPSSICQFNCRNELRGKVWNVCRYVDNRVVLGLKIQGQSTIPFDLRDQGFYGDAIKLAPEDKHKLVGAQLILPDRQWRSSDIAMPALQCRFYVDGFPEHYAENWSLPPGSRWQYRTPMSASSQSSLFSALHSRLHLAWRTSYPPQRTAEALARIAFLYVHLGYQPQTLALKFERFMKNRGIPSRFASDLVKAILRSDCKSLHCLGGK